MYTLIHSATPVATIVGATIADKPVLTVTADTEFSGKVYLGSGFVSDDIVHTKYSYTKPFGRTNFYLDVVIPNDPEGNTVRLQNNSPATNLFYFKDGRPYVELIGTGTIDVDVLSSVAGTKYRQALGLGITVDLYEYESFAAGTLGEHCENSILALVSGNSPGDTSQKFWDSYTNDYLNPACVPNPNNIFVGYDWSGVSTHRSTISADSFPCSVVSIRHALCAKHVRIQVGESVVFRKPDGSFLTAICDAVQGIVRPPELSDMVLSHDLAIAHFDRDLTGLKQYKVMPSGWEFTYAPSLRQASINGSNDLYYSSIAQVRKTRHDLTGANVSYTGIDASYVSWGPPYYTRFIFSAYQTELTSWYTKIIGGDSGGPNFLIIDGELILAACQHHNGGSTAIEYFITELNDLMDTTAGAVSGTWKLQHPELSSFNSY